MDKHFEVIQDLSRRGWRGWSDWLITGDPRDGPMAHNWVWAYRPGWVYPIRMGGRASNPEQGQMNVAGLYWKPAADEETPETALALPKPVT